MEPFEFSQIQQAAGLSDRAVAALLGYAKNGPRRVRRFRLGQRAIPPRVAAAMRSIETRPPALP